MSTAIVGNAPTETANELYLPRIFNTPNFVWGFVDPTAPADPKKPKGKTLQVKILNDVGDTFQRASMQDLTGVARAESFGEGMSVGPATHAFALAARGLVRLAEYSPNGAVRAAASDALDALVTKMDTSGFALERFPAALQELPAGAPSKLSRDLTRIENPDQWPKPERVIDAIQRARLRREYIYAQD